MQTKTELRKIIFERKQKSTFEQKKEKSNQIFEQLTATEIFKKSQSILCYWSTPDEVHTHDFIQKYVTKKDFFLPVVTKEKLLIKAFQGVENLVKGPAFGIFEPNKEIPETKLKKIDLIIVPAVAFDLKGGRLGHGKGYYDRLLKKFNGEKIGVCFDFQLVDKVPVEPHDIPIQHIIFG